MQLFANLLLNVTDVNHFTYATGVHAQVGDAFTVYLQLADLDQGPPERAGAPMGLRYAPAAGATLTARFRNLDAARQFVRFASQPFAGDPSIWSLPILAADPVRGTVDLVLTLTEGAVVRTARVPAALLVGVGAGPELV